VGDDDDNDALVKGRKEEWTLREEAVDLHLLQ